ncbi:glucose repression regulatory protein TUP1 [Rhodotorula toruloides]|uniref:Glucose repression regulatory protein TUP1 n=1 Tax=Rhodotorula toruloides TaxID=5286 RepID=A0A511KA39_RHOTO|nr:glucose repression regulatory protein TUP1 [Rhodotorula toruloides]
MASRAVYEHRSLAAAPLTNPPGSASGVPAPPPQPPAPGSATPSAATPQQGAPQQGQGMHPAAMAGAAAGHPMNGLLHPPPPSSGPPPPPSAGPPPGVVGLVAPPHPSAQRLNDLLEFVKAEFEQVAGEGSVLRVQREEYEAMIHAHASELNAMRTMVYDLERKYHDDKRVLQEENSRLQEENSHLRQQLDTSRSSISSQPGPGRAAGARPASGGFPVLGAGAGGEGANGAGGAGEHPSASAASQRPAIPQTGSRPPSTGPVAPPSSTHQPSPLPPSAPTASSPSAPSTTAKDEKPPVGEVTSFDPGTAPKELKKEGPDWVTMFNPNVKRALDVGLVHTLVHDSVVCCVRFSPDGKILATGSNRNTTLYDTKTGARIAQLCDESANQKADNYIRSVSFSPDGKLMATGSEDRIVRVWNLAHKRISQVFSGHASEIYSLAFSPDGRRLVSGSGDKTARMWDVDSGSCAFTLTIHDITIAENGPVDAGVTSVAFSPDGKYLAAGSLDTVVRIWDAETGQLLDKLKGHEDSVYSVAFSPDSKFLVSGSLDKTLKMFDINAFKTALAAAPKDAPVGEGGKATLLTTLQGHKDYVLSVDVSPDSAWILSGSKDRAIQMWSSTTAKSQWVLQGHKNSVISVAISPVGGLFATASGDWSSRIWSYNTLPSA